MNSRIYPEKRIHKNHLSSRGTRTAAVKITEPRGACTPEGQTMRGSQQCSTIFHAADAVQARRNTFGLTEAVSSTTVVSELSMSNYVITDSDAKGDKDGHGNPPFGVPWIEALHHQTLFINFDRDDEKVYKAYFRRQRLGVLPVLAALAIVHAVLCLVLDLEPGYRVSILDRVIVMGLTAGLVSCLLLIIYFGKCRERITESLAVVMWLLITFQIFYDVSTTYPLHMPSDRIGWLVLHIFVTLMTIPVGVVISAPLVVLLILTHCVLEGVFATKQPQAITLFANQIAANILLCSASTVMGLAGSLFLDRLNRKSVLETKSALSAKARIELAYKDKERLLLSVLPKHVADEMLKDVGNLDDGQFRKIYMSRYENVSILFADIVGFTAISSSVTASELVRILNELFASFDVLAKKFHQTRIKILGDCYYCVCGALKPRSDHAVLSIHMGLSMVDAISTVRRSTGKDVNMRVGVHTGACLGGVLGQRQWQFDILGKEVTLANKMESGGLPGRVHLSEKTKSCLHDEFELEDGHGGDREDTLKLNNIVTYLVKSVKKPYPEGTLDMSAPPSPGKTAGTGHKRPIDSVSDDSVSRDMTSDTFAGSPGGTKKEDYKKELSRKLQRELLAKEKDRDFLETFQHVTLKFKDKALENRYQKRSDSYNGLPVVALCVALSLEFIAKLCVLPRTDLLIAVNVSGGVILLCMSMVSMAVTLAKCFPKGAVRFGVLIERNRILRLLWGLSACLVFFICDTVPVIECFQNSYNETEAALTEFNTSDTHCHYIVYVTHGASLVLVAVSSMVNLGHMTKGVLIFLVTGLHCVIVLLFISAPYDYYNKVIYDTNDGKPYSHIKYRLLGQMIASAVAMNFFNFQMEFTSRRLYMWKEDSKKEKERASDLQHKNEALVYNLLPPHVASDFLGRKKRDSELYSHSYEDVGVLFAACPNFHAFYNESAINNNGLECLRFLNEIISDYDELLNQSKFSTIVKIKTVGPTYMAASGMVVKENRKDHASIQDTWGHLHDLVQFAHALQVVLKKINEQSFNNFILRIGINHGPVIAGVIGARKPHYDIWGNTVNVASRMESTGQSGRIQLIVDIRMTEDASVIIQTNEIREKKLNIRQSRLSTVVEETKSILEVFGYTFEKRGLIKVKGKGELMTYFLESGIGVDAEDITIPNQVPSLYSSHLTTTSS